MIKVAVYGTLREGFPNHALLHKSTLIGEATVPGRMHDLGPFPAVCLHEKGTVKVELYEVDEETLELLDRLEGHPTLYQRVDVMTSEGPAFMYVMSEDELLDSPSIPSGDWADKKAA